MLKIMFAAIRLYSQVGADLGVCLEWNCAKYKDLLPASHLDAMFYSTSK